MAYRIVNTFKRFAVQAAVRFMPVGRFDPVAPQPRVRHFDDQGAVSRMDDFLFDPVTSGVSAAAEMLGAELDRVSSKIGEIRQLLSDMTRFEPAETVEVNAVSGQNFAWAEDILFDGDMLGDPQVPVLSLEGLDDFLFENEDAIAPRWQVLRPAMMPAGVQHA